MISFVPERLLSVRRFRGYTQKELADRSGLSKTMISEYEQGISAPSPIARSKLSNTLQIRIEYFYFLSRLALGTVNFQREKRFNKKRLYAIQEGVRQMVGAYLEIEDILNIDSVFQTSLKQKGIHSIEEIKDIVLKLREEWEVGLGPIHNIIQVFEDQKIKVVQISEDISTFDGTSTLISDKYPVIVLNKNLTVEQKRFTLFYELGHLLLDVTKSELKAKKSFCTRFAKEFLFSKAALIKEFGTGRDPIVIDEIVFMHKKYGITFLNIVERLIEEKLITKSKREHYYENMELSERYKKRVLKSRFKTPQYSDRFKHLINRAAFQRMIELDHLGNIFEWQHPKF